MKHLRILVAGLFATVLVVAAAVLFLVDRSLDQPLQVADEGMTFQIAPGTSFTAISNSLAAQEIISYPRILRWYARVTSKASAVHAGEYRLEKGMSVRDLLNAFLTGNVQLYSFTIVEGWNFRELLGAMARNDAIETTIDVEDSLRLPELVGAAYAHPEGLFLPETYRFPRGTQDIEVLRQAFQHMQAALDEEWRNRDPATPLKNPYEALILASIVEKETARADERARIAGVFIRRLEQRMRLQTDPTVIYGIGAEFNGNLTRADLQSDTPYNTYTRGGLPPTPIAMPGREAIHAVLHPEPGVELYFVATGLGDGSHKFSATKEEHDAAVQELIRRLRANRRSAEGQ